MNKYAKPSWATYDQITPSPNLLIQVHGGGDLTAPNLKGWQDYARMNNIITAAINYRLGQPSFPGVLYDIKQAYDHLVGIHHPDKVTILGSSAGATIALSAMLHYKIPARFIGFYGLYDLTRKQDFASDVNGMIDQYIGTGIYTRRHASPSFTAPGNIDGMLIHGEDDTVVKSDQSIRMHIKTGWGLRTIPGANHAFNVISYLMQREGLLWAMRE